jgi:hypothetical protein
VSTGQSRLWDVFGPPKRPISRLPFGSNKVLRARGTSIEQGREIPSSLSARVNLRRELATTWCALPQPRRTRGPASARRWNWIAMLLPSLLALTPEPRSRLADDQASVQRERLASGHRWSVRAALEPTSPLGHGRVRRSFRLSTLAGSCTARSWHRAMPVLRHRQGRPAL